MEDVNAWCLALQHGQAADHRVVDCVRALAAAEHEDRWGSAALGRNLKECLAHRDSCDLNVTKIL